MHVFVYITNTIDVFGKFKKLGRISIRDMENYIFTVSPSSTVEKES